MTKTKTNRVRRWAVRLIGGLILLAAATTGVYYGLLQAAVARWERLAAEIRAEGSPLTYADIRAEYEATPGELEAADLIRRTAELYRSVEKPSVESVLGLSSDCRSPSRGIRVDCIDPSYAFVTAYEPVIDDLRQLSELPTARFERAYGDPSFDIIGQAGANASDFRKLAKLVAFHGFLGIIENDGSRSTEAVEILLDLTRPMLREPRLVEHLVGIANGAMAVRLTEELLLVRNVGQGHLHRIVAAWEQTLPYWTLRSPLLGERASCLLYTDHAWLKAQMSHVFTKYPEARSVGFRLPNPVNWIPFREDWQITTHRIDSVESITRLLEASADPVKLIWVAQREAELASQRRPEDPIAILIPSLTRSTTLHSRSLALLRCTRVALASEEYRLATGKFPSSIEEILPKFLSAILQDPFDGQPLRILNHDEGIVIYSIGEDMRDDGGQLERKYRKEKGWDTGFRLVYPKHRRLILLDAEMDQE